MAEYIELEVAFNTITDLAGKAPTRSAYEAVWKSARALKKIPVADVGPVVHGKWERVANPNWPAHIHDKCSICGWWNTRNALCYDGSNKPGHSLNYRPNCGAKMDGDDADRGGG